MSPAPVGAAGHFAPRSFLVRTLRYAALAAVVGGIIGLAPLCFGQAQAADATHIRVAANAMGSTQQVSMSPNKSMILDLPVDVQEVIVSQPGVANAIMRSKRRAVVQSVGAGDTNIFFLDGQGRTVVVLDVSIKGAVSNVAAALRDTFAKVLPSANIDVESVALVDANGTPINRVVLSGYARTPEDVAKAVEIAAQFAGAPENVASVVSVGGPQQVMLKVTVAEVQREAVKQLGIDMTGSFSGGSLTTGFVSDQPLGGASNVVTSNAASLQVAGGGLTVKATLKALERHGALRTLAEPTLTAMSGSEAEFLAGGEFPVPTEIDSEGKVSYTYKEFGVKLKFTPTIKSNGDIGLLIDTAVSEPTTEGGFNIGGLTIPATKQRQAKTSVEMGVGQTLSIGGLMQDTVRQQINRLPGLGDIPILGALFRSRDFIHSQTELIVLVTPYYATAGDPPPLPTDNMTVANDAEAIFLGHIEKTYGVGPGGTRGSYDGSVGFLLD